MRLDFNYDFGSMRHFLENLGSFRFSPFYSVEKSSLGLVVQKIASFVLSIFVGLYAYDCIAQFLPLKLRVIARGALCLLASCLGLNVLLKSLQKSKEVIPAKEVVPTPPEENISEHKEEREDLIFDLEMDLEEEVKSEEIPEEETHEEKTPFRRVKRNLLAEFDEVAKSI